MLQLLLLPMLRLLQHVPKGVSALEDNITITKELFLLVIQDQEVQSFGRTLAGHQSDPARSPKSASSGLRV